MRRLLTIGVVGSVTALLLACGEGRSGGLAVSSTPPGMAAPLPAARPPSFYVSAYYAPLKTSMIPVADIDFSAITHLHYFGVRPSPTGELTGSVDANVVAAAHAAKVPVVLTVGGSDSQVAFEAAMAPEQRDSFVQNMVSLVTSLGVDGVDLDMEPIFPADDVAFADLVTALRSALPPPLLLTSTLKWEKTMFASVQSSFDRLNLLTYHLIGGARLSWHNAALYSPTVRTEETDAPLPSCDSEVQDALSSGIDPQKLSLGIDFNGDIWTGIDAPLQAASEKAATGVTFAQIIAASFYTPAARNWDSKAEVPYLSVDAGSASQFVSYDDATSVSLKVAYAFSHNLGGVMLWNLGAGHLADAGVGARDPLLAAVAAAIASGGDAGTAERPLR